MGRLKNIKKSIFFIRYLQEERDECEDICDKARIEIEYLIKQSHHDFNVYDDDLDKVHDELDNDSKDKCEDIRESDYDKPPPHTPRWVKTIFRKIVMITHPDKIPESLSENVRSKFLKIYQDSKEAIDSEDYSKILILASDLDIDLSSIDIEDDDIFKNKEKKLITHITSLKSSLFWKWAHSSVEEREKIFHEFIRVRGWTTKESHRRKSRKGSGTHPGKSIAQIKNMRFLK